MPRWLKRFLVTLAALALVLAIIAAILGERALRIGAAYGAKIMASGVFVAERSPESMLEEELAFYDFLDFDVDRADQSVTVSFHGIAAQKAVYIPGRGTVLVHDTEDAVRAWVPGPAPLDDADALWPTGDVITESPLPPGVDATALKKAVLTAFEDHDPELRARTRAIVVLYQGQLVAEHYAEGFSKDSRLIGWSMTKSVTNALVGILVNEGRLDIHAPAAVPEWQDAGDPRRAITLDQLLRMSSGLAFDEDYGNPFGDAVQMLFGSSAAGDYAAASPLGVPPDTQWYYSSGTTNLIQRIIRDTVGDDAYPAFPRRALFDRIGMRSAIIEADASGTFVGSSFMYATARDWARFGLLFLNDGVWEGQRILPAGWVDYSRRPTPPADRGRYGAQWWLNAGDPGHPETRVDPGLPADWFFASGFEGQTVNIFPSRDLVVVRLGFTENQRAWPLVAFLEGILKCFPPPDAASDSP